MQVNILDSAAEIASTHVGDNIECRGKPRNWVVTKAFVPDGRPPGLAPCNTFHQRSERLLLSTTPSYDGSQPLSSTSLTQAMGSDQGCEGMVDYRSIRIGPRSRNRVEPKTSSPCTVPIGFYFDATLATPHDGPTRTAYCAGATPSTCATMLGGRADRRSATCCTERIRVSDSACRGRLRCRSRDGPQLHSKMLWCNSSHGGSFLHHLAGRAA